MSATSDVNKGFKQLIEALQNLIKLMKLSL